MKKDQELFRCPRCRRNLPLYEFLQRSDRGDNRQRYCIKCNREIHTAAGRYVKRDQLNREQYKAWRRNRGT